MANQKTKRVKKICPACGKAFYTLPSKSNKRFCSPEYYNNWLSSGMKRTERPTRCLACGKPINGKENIKSHFDLFGFCSIDCRRRYYARTRTGRIETCQTCGRSFFWSADENAIGYYCSEECLHDGIERASKGFRLKPGRRGNGKKR